MKLDDERSAGRRFALAITDIDRAAEEIANGGLPANELGELVTAPSVPIVPRIGAENVVELPPPKDTRLLLPVVDLSAGTNA
jgi:hypothetical protein